MAWTSPKCRSSAVPRAFSPRNTSCSESHELNQVNFLELLHETGGIHRLCRTSHGASIFLWRWVFLVACCMFFSNLKVLDHPVFERSCFPFFSVPSGVNFHPIPGLYYKIGGLFYSEKILRNWVDFLSPRFRTPEAAKKAENHHERRPSQCSTTWLECIGLCPRVLVCHVSYSPLHYAGHLSRRLRRIQKHVRTCCVGAMP